MTLEEALGKITDSEVKAFFTKMVADQNSYITKLETQLKEKQTATSSTQPARDDITTQYLMKKMREDVVNEAIKVIVAAVGKEIYDAVSSDFLGFLDKNLTPERTTVEYVVDAFNLVYGRCFARKDHPVHQVGKTATNPSGTPTNTPGTNGAQVAAVNNIIANQPPVMTGTDTSAGQGLPGVQGTPVKTTRDAFSRLKDRIGQSGGNRFQ